ncbi:hypothetical protein J7K52_04805 [Candidatus Bathyarchaeota archaeon]|nr:hypothetical protein [Candidatus Bathyarchaeota archaeon]
MSIRSALGYLASSILLILAVVFALASVHAPIRLVTSAFLFIAGFTLLYYLRRRKPITIIQRVEVPGNLKVQTLKCPNCSAPINLSDVKVVKGIPTLKCPYCGYVFEVTEEPKW